MVKVFNRVTTGLKMNYICIWRVLLSDILKEIINANNTIFEDT
jgi:hypothetical protein